MLINKMKFKNEGKMLTLIKQLNAREIIVVRTSLLLAQLE